MTQNATVVELLENGQAKIVVARQSACAHDCSKCAGGCGATVSPVYAQAENPIGAVPGDKVVVESSTKTVLGTALIVYLLPLALFLVGFLLGLGRVPDKMEYLLGVLGFGIGLLLAKAWDRKLKKKGGLVFRITGKL